MDKQNLLYSVIELVILLIPIITLLFRYAGWKKEIDIEIKNLKESDKRQDAYYTQITQQLSDIAKTLTALEVKLTYIEKFREDVHD